MSDDSIFICSACFTTLLLLLTYVLYSTGFDLVSYSSFILDFSAVNIFKYLNSNFKIKLLEHTSM